MNIHKRSFSMNKYLSSQQGIIRTLPLLIVIAAVGIISFLLISSTAPTGGLFNTLNPKPASNAANGNVTITPTVIPITTLFTDEIPNPNRGEYLWFLVSTDPSGWPAHDSYIRYHWRDLEPTQGNYNFSDID